MTSAGPRGFTLVEVMVALAITAIALVAGLKATAAQTDNADRQGAVLLAQLCAENTLTELRLARQLPGVGDFDSDCTQAGQPRSQGQEATVSRVLRSQACRRPKPRSAMPAPPACPS